MSVVATLCLIIPFNAGVYILKNTMVVWGRGGHFVNKNEGAGKKFKKGREKVKIASKWVKMP